jgi:TonB-linked SusC/RagA family outer membrane protein
MSTRRTLAFSLLVVALCSAHSADAQDTVNRRGGRAHLTGQALDARTGEPLPGVNISIVGTNLGATTSEQGRFSIPNAPSGVFAVEARRLGFALQRRENVRLHADSTTTLEFRLTDAPLRLDQIVTSATIDATTAAKSTVAVDHLSAEDLPVPSISGASGAIMGKVPGAMAMRPSGRPGAETNIVLRTPISGFDFQRDAPPPLFVVDGVFLNQSQDRTTQDLETLDIASIEVLKGAAASALYGSRAAAGVISVTTNRGKNLGLGSVEYSIRYERGEDQFVKALQKNQHHNFQQNDQGQWLDANGNVVPRSQRATTPFNIMDQPYRNTPLYDAAKQLFQPGGYNTVTSSVQGNTAATNFFASYSRTENPGILKYNDGYDRQTFRLNVDGQVRDNLSVSFSLNHARSKDDNPATNFDSYYVFDPDVNLLSIDPHPRIAGFIYNIVPDSVSNRTNPLFAEYVSDNLTRRARSNIASHLSWRPVEWVAFASDLSYDRGDVRGDSFTPLNTPVNNNGSIALSTGQIVASQSTTDGITFAAGPTFTNQFRGLTTRATLRGELQRESTPSFSVTGQDFKVEGVRNIAAAKTITSAQGYEDRRTKAVVSSLGLSYHEKYIGDFLLRRDGSSLFGPAHRWNNFYRASAAWLMGDESWFPFKDFSTFKLRYSLGTAGDRPRFTDQYETLTLDASGALVRNVLGNVNLGPTISREQELGLDFTYKQRISGSLTYATNDTKDSFISIPAPALSGYSNVLTNAGGITGNTLELTLQGQILTRKNLSWTMLLVGDHSSNIITDYKRSCFVDATDGPHYRCSGVRYGTMWGQVFVMDKTHLRPEHQNSYDQFDKNDDGFIVPVGPGNTWRDGIAKSLWGTTVTIDGRTYPWGRPIVEFNPATGQNLLTQIGDGNPAFHFGWGNNVRYKNYHAFLQTTGQVGGDVYAKSIQNYWSSGDWKDVDQFGKPDERKKPVTYYSSIANAVAYSQPFVRSGTYLNIQEALIGYTLNGRTMRQLQRFGLTRMEVNLIGRNLATLTNYRGLNVMAGTPTRHEDAATYPLTRTLTGSVTLTF